MKESCRSRDIAALQIPLLRIESTRGKRGSGGPDGAIGMVRHFMADQGATGSSAIVRKRHPAIRRHYIQVEVDQPVAADASISTRDAMSAMTGGAAETGIDVSGVLRPAGIFDDIAREVVALAAHCVRPVHGKVRIWVQDCNPLARTWGLAEFVTALQKMGPFGAVRAVGTESAEFAIVVTVMTICAENLCAHETPLACSVQLGHVGEKTGLRVTRGTSVRNRMARRRRRGKLRDDVTGIGRVGNIPHRQVPEFRCGGLPCRGPMAAEAVLELVHRGRDRCDSIAGRNSTHPALGGTNERRHRERRHWLRPMWVVAVRTGGMAIVVQKSRLRRIVCVISRKIRMIGRL